MITVTPPPAGGPDEANVAEGHVGMAHELLDHCAVMLAEEEQVCSFGRADVPDGTSVSSIVIDDDIAVFARSQMAVAVSVLAVGDRLGELVELGERVAVALERLAAASEDSADVAGDTYDEGKRR